MKISVLLIFIIFFSVVNIPFVISDEVHEGDYVVENGQELIIKDRIFHIDGNLELKEGSSLKMENAVLIIKERYKSEHALIANGADIEIINSEIRSSENIMAETYGSLIGPELNLHMRDQTDVVIKNSQIYGRVGLESSLGKISNSTVSYVYWTLDSNLDIDDSIVGSFVFDCKRGISGNMLLDGLKKDKNIDFSIEKIPEGGSLKIMNTNVKNTWSFNLEVECKKNITVSNSEFDLFWIKFPPTENRIKINGLPNGFVKQFDLSDAVSGINLPYNLKLSNVQMDKFKPEMLSTKAEITNSYVMVHPYDESDLIIRNSILNALNNYGCKRIEFINTTILGPLQLIYKPEFSDGRKLENKVIGPGGYFHYVFNNSFINSQTIVVACIEGVIEGDVQIISPKNFDDLHWINGTITRIYPVIANPNNTIKLLIDDSAQEINTNKDGMAYFNITFDNTSYTKELWVEAGNNKKGVNFLTDTPIDLREGEPENLPAELPTVGFNIYIVFIILIVAVAVGMLMLRKFKK